jgi:hypothetical protein
MNSRKIRWIRLGEDKYMNIFVLLIFIFQEVITPINVLIPDCLSLKASGIQPLAKPSDVRNENPVLLFLPTVEISKCCMGQRSVALYAVSAPFTLLPCLPSYFNFK